jgi:hypothetical protein
LKSIWLDKKDIAKLLATKLENWVVPKTEEAVIKWILSKI